MWTMLAFAKPRGTKLDDIAGQKFTGPEGLVQWESMFVIVWPPDRMPGDPELDIYPCLQTYRTWHKAFL